MRNITNHPPECDVRPPNHTNAFLSLNSVPYLLGEYLDRQQFRQLDRSMIQSQISVDSQNSMRAVVKIDIDDIGKRSNGLPNIVGNRSKDANLIKLVKQMANKLDHRFNVIKRGIIIRINYRLENNRTLRIIRSASEDLRIRDRNYFVDINPRNIDDNAIVINFMDQVVSSINQFTHGTDKMILRITSIQMFYECLKRDGTMHNTCNMLTDVDDILPEVNDEFLEHHSRYQHRHAIGIEGTCTCDDFMYNEKNPMFPPNWLMFNRFYHFDSHAKDIILHFQEINDRMNKIFLIPCGNVHVNRSFMVNPGHRIVFKLSVWKNDLISIANTTRIAQAIGARVGDFPQECPRPKPPINIDLETIIRLVREKDHIDTNQNRVIRYLIKAVKELQKNQSSDDGPPIEEIPGGDGNTTEPDTNGSCDCPEIDSISDEQISEILDETEP